MNAPASAPAPPALAYLDELLTVNDLIALLKISRRSVWRWVAEGRLPQPVRYSATCVRWKASVIETWLAAH
jgi:prophage regulatory protein